MSKARNIGSNSAVGHIGWKYDPPVCDPSTDDDQPDEGDVVATEARAEDADEGDPLLLDPASFRTFDPTEEPGYEARPAALLPGGKPYDRRVLRVLLGGLA